MAPITEDKETIARNFGRGGITSALSEMLIRALDVLDANGIDATFEELSRLSGVGLDDLIISLNGEYVVKMGLGDIVLFEESFISPVFERSTDFSGNLSSEPVPEPSTILLLGSGLAGLAFYRRKRK